MEDRYDFNQFTKVAKKSNTEIIPTDGTQREQTILQKTILWFKPGFRGNSKLQVASLKYENSYAHSLPVCSSVTMNTNVYTEPVKGIENKDISALGWSTLFLRVLSGKIGHSQVDQLNKHE